MKQFDHSRTGEEIIQGHELSNKRIVITGASSGLGAETARLLAGAGAELVLAVRDAAAGEEVAQRISAEAGRKPQVLSLDLGNLASVRKFAASLGNAPVNVLVNNAGVMATPYGRTVDGFETQMGVNHFGHFLLTQLLMPCLLNGAPSRVVSLSSSGHIWSGVDFDDIHFERRVYNPWIAYGQSKTANILFAVEMTRRYAKHGLIANAVMPGRILDTALRRYTTDKTYELSPAMGATQPTVEAPVNNQPKTLGQGVATTIWAVVDPRFETEGGYYLEDCGIALPWSAANPRRGVKDHAVDSGAAERLWTVSEVEVAHG